MYLPNVLNFISPNGEFNLIASLNRLKYYATERLDMGVFQLELMNLIRYQMIWGFWDRSSRKVHNVDALKIEEAVKEIQRGKKDLEFQQKMIDNLKKKVEQEKEEVDTLIVSLQESINGIIKQKTESEQKNIEIQQILNYATEQKGKIDTSKVVIELTSDDIKAKAEEAKNELSTFQTESVRLKEELRAALTDAKGKIQYINESHSDIKDKRDFIHLKEEEIVHLATQASNGAMGHMFDKRKTSLGNSVRFWMVATIVATLSLLAWIFIVFLCLNTTDYEPNWINPLLATLKTVPAFIILAFCSRQYNKERSLQEEYAFKAAIAMTLNAYADEIEYSEDPDRRELIKKSIEKIHQQPQIKKDHYGLFDFSGRKKREELMQYFKETLEVIKKSKA